MLNKSIHGAYYIVDTEKWLALSLNIKKSYAEICPVSVDTNKLQLLKHNCQKYYNYFCNNIFYFKMIKCLASQDT